MQLAWLAEHQAEGDRAGGPHMTDLAGDHPVHIGYILGLPLNRVEQEGDRAGGPRMADLAGDHPLYRVYLLGYPFWLSHDRTGLAEHHGEVTLLASLL